MTTATTSAKDWKKNSGLSPKPLKVPSGNTCLVRQPGMEVFVTTGIVPNSLMGIITDAINKGKEPDFEALTKDASPEMIADVITMANAVTCYCVIEPQVESNVWTKRHYEAGECGEHEIGKEIPPSKRDQDALYVDEVDMEDKLFIFNVAVGGSADATKFRSELEAGVASVRDGKDRPVPTKRTGGAKRAGSKRK